MGFSIVRLIPVLLCCFLFLCHNFETPAHHQRAIFHSTNKTPLVPKGFKEITACRRKCYGPIYPTPEQLELEQSRRKKHSEKVKTIITKSQATKKCSSSRERSRDSKPKATSSTDKTVKKKQSLNSLKKGK